jgi:hypothetical protein
LKNCTLYPIFHVIKAAKEECYPYKDTVLFQEYLAEVYVQAFVNKKALRSVLTFIL